MGTRDPDVAMTGEMAGHVARRLIESARMRHWSAWAALTLILTCAAALRFWNISAGLPYRVGVDEPVIAERAVHMMKSGDFNPHFFDYPGLYIYIQLLVACVRFVTGALEGSWRSLDQFWPEHLFLWTRVLNAALGTATVFVVYRAGLHWNQGTALLAATLMAVWPNHVRESHFALTDVPVTLLTTVALVISLRAYETGRLSAFVAAGVAAGCAAATKYNGAVAVLMPLIAAATTLASSARVRSAMAAIAGAAAAFLLCAPYTVLDLPEFLNAFAYMAVSYRPRPFPEGADIYLGHLRVALGPLGLLVLALGLGWSVVRAAHMRDTGRWLLLLVFPVVYFQMVATKQLIFARYLLPVMPFACLLMAVVLADALQWIRNRGRVRPMARAAAMVALVVAVLAYPTRTAGEWPVQHGRRTTLDLAYRLVQQVIPSESTVVVENGVLRLPESRYRQVYAASLAEHTAKEYAEMGATYFVASSDAFGPVMDHPDKHPEANQAYQELFEEHAECMPTVKPTPTASGPQIRICRLRTE